MKLEDQKMQQPKQPVPVEKKPDDKGNIQIDCHLRIFDPNTKKVILETRA